MCDKRDSQKKRFIKALTAQATVFHAAQAAGISRWTAYRWRDNDPAFAQAWNDALEDCGDIMESSVYQRGLAGDSILSMFWLKAKRPAFRDKVAVDIPTIQNQVREFIQELLRSQVSQIYQEQPNEMRGLKPKLLEAPKAEPDFDSDNPLAFRVYRTRNRTSR
jgi:hypothetical protein